MKTKLLQITCCFIAMFFFQFTMKAATPPVRGVYMFVSNLTENNQAIVDVLATNAVKDVYLQAKGTSGDFPTPAPLTDFITRAKAAGLKVYLGYVILEDQYYLSENPNARVWKCPDPVNNKINQPHMITTTNFLNLLYPGYKEYVVDNIAFLLEEYDFDGVFLENLRYTHFVYSFDPISTKRAAAMGCDTLKVFSYFNTTANYTTYAIQNGIINLYDEGTDPDVNKWFEMRKGVLSEYITSIRDTMNVVRPGLKLSAHFMPEGAETASMKFAHAHYGQDFAVQSAFLDEISPQAHLVNFSKTNTDWIKTITETAKSRVHANCNVVTFIQQHSSLTPQVLGEQIDKAIAGESKGVIITSYSTVNSTNSWSIVKTKYEALAPSSVRNVYEDLMLDQNIPNPFSSNTKITFKVEKFCRVELNVYDAVGRKVAVIVNQHLNPGAYSFDFEASGLSDGIYFYRLNADGSSAVRKMIKK